MLHFCLVSDELTIRIIKNTILFCELIHLRTIISDKVTEYYPTYNYQLVPPINISFTIVNPHDEVSAEPNI